MREAGLLAANSQPGAQLLIPESQISDFRRNADSQKGTAEDRERRRPAGIGRRDGSAPSVRIFPPYSWLLTPIPKV